MAVLTQLSLYLIPRPTSAAPLRLKAFPTLTSHAIASLAICYQHLDNQEPLLLPQTKSLSLEMEMSKVINRFFKLGAPIFNTTKEKIYLRVIPCIREFLVSWWFGLVFLLIKVRFSSNV